MVLALCVTGRRICPSVNVERYMGILCLTVLNLFTLHPSPFTVHQQLCSLQPKDKDMVHKRKNHFYEGWLYHLFVDPALRRMRRMIGAQVEPGSTLIDIGCGTGELLFFLADMCSELVGIEASYRMWDYASKRVGAFSPVRILHGDGARLEDFSNGHFDYATACMVFHEMEESQRFPVLREMQRVARTLILVDYRVPPPTNIEASLCRLIERLAGKTHYGNYTSFARAGGLPFLMKAVDLTIQKEISFQRECFCLVKTHLNDT